MTDMKQFHTVKVAKYECLDCSKVVDVVQICVDGTNRKNDINIRTPDRFDVWIKPCSKCGCEHFNFTLSGYIK